MYSDFTLLFQQAGPFSERFPVSTMINLQTNKETLTASTFLVFHLNYSLRREQNSAKNRSMQGRKILIYSEK